MKLLMIYCDRFAFSPADKSLPEVEDGAPGGEVRAALVGLIHAEAADEEEPARVEKKLIKNLKWGARKNGTEQILLHSFSHLAETKANAEFTRELLMRAQQRLEQAGYPTRQTPFGFFNDLDLQAPGRSTARIFTSF